MIIDPGGAGRHSGNGEVAVAYAVRVNAIHQGGTAVDIGVGQFVIFKRRLRCVNADLVLSIRQQTTDLRRAWHHTHIGWHRHREDGAQARVGGVDEVVFTVAVGGSRHQRSAGDVIECHLHAGNWRFRRILDAIHVQICPDIVADFQRGLIAKQFDITHANGFAKGAGLIFFEDFKIAGLGAGLVVQKDDTAGTNVARVKDAENDFVTAGEMG